MSSCSRCMNTPIYENEDQDIYITAYSEHIMNKITDVMDEHHCDYELKGKYIYAFVDNVIDYINCFRDSDFLSSIEKKEVFISILPPNTQFSFSKYLDVRPLSYWISYWNNYDIVEVVNESRIKTLYQPILTNKSLQLWGHEALTRGIKKNGDLIYATRLFGVCKELDLLFNLDRQCRLAAINNTNKFPDYDKKLFVNFIPTIIYDPKTCLNTTHSAVKNSHFKPEDVIFEVVESELIEDYDHLLAILQYYKEKGYQSALDDVGAGFSTLGVYEKLGTEYIKVDKNITRNLLHSDAAKGYLEHVLELKRKNGVRIVAEGVETEDVYNYIKNKDVDFVQGYYFAEPSEILRTD